MHTEPERANLQEKITTIARDFSRFHFEGLNALLNVTKLNKYVRIINDDNLKIHSACWAINIKMNFLFALRACTHSLAKERYYYGGSFSFMGCEHTDR